MSISASSSYLVLLGCLVLSVTNVDSTAAHKIEVAADVGGTLHMEPNDNPSAGETTQAWFALTRRGGKIVPLNQCDCQLAVYAEPHTPEEPALLEPSLKPVDAERYQGIPGANIIFPKAGIYQLHLTGKPTSGANFRPFKFTFDVTVAGGTDSTNTQKTQRDGNLTTELKSIPVWAMALPIVALLGGLFAVWKKGAGSKK